MEKNKVLEGKVVKATEETTVAEVKESLWQKTKATADKVWNSKPMKIGKKAVLVVGGVVIGLALSNVAKKEDPKLSEDNTADILNDPDLEVINLDETID